MKIEKLTPVFTEHIPKGEDMKEGMVYVSLKYEIAIHKCCCGCGHQSVTPFSENEWKLTYDEKFVTLYPSILNRFCKSHYYLTNNNVEWC